MNEVFIPSRRRFISHMPLLATSPLIYPSILNAREKELNYKSLKYITRLHPVRFVAGLIFDFFESIFVDFVSDVIVSSLYNGTRPSNVNIGRTRGTESTNSFLYPNYKASNVILGVSDYEAHKKRKIKILLKGLQQEDKFSKFIRYINDEKIRIKTTDREYSSVIGLDAEPDELFMIDYFQFESNKEEHYKNLISITGVDVFNNWSV